MKQNIVFVFIGKLAFQGRILKQVESLEKIGSQITLVLGNINGEESNLEQFKFPVINRIIRYNVSKIFSFLSQLSFCFSAFRLINMMKDIEYIQCCGLATLLSGVFLKMKNKNLVLIYDSTELTVEREKGIKRKVWKLIQIFSLPYCDYILQAEPFRLEFFQKEYRISPSKLVMIGNFPYLNKSHSIEIERNKNKIKILYFGIIGMGRGYPELIQAVDGIPNCELHLIGPGDTKFISEIKDICKNSGNIKILPPVNNNEIQSVFVKYDIGFAYYENTNLNNYYCAPNKVYDYLNNGLPIISNAYPGLIAIIEKNKVGVCIKSLTRANISLAIERIISEKMKNNITMELKKKYSWDFQEEKYLGLFK